MSTVLSCRDAFLANNTHYSATTAAYDTFDFSTETPRGASYLDNALHRREHVCLHDTLQTSTWFSHISAHLQHNKQLQDTLIQKEEELARLQEENNKLKKSLNLAYVKSLKKSKRFLFRQTNSELRKRKITTNEDSVNLSHLPRDSEEMHTHHKLSLKLCLPKDVSTTPPLDSRILETLGLHNEGISCFSNSKTDQTSFSQVTTIDQKAFKGPGLQNSNVQDTYSETQCEYRSAKGSSNLMSHVETCTEYVTIDTSHLNTVTKGPLINSLPAIVSTGHITPPGASLSPQHIDTSKLWQYCYSYDISSPPGHKEALFYVPHTTESKMDLAFSMSLSSQSTVKTQSYPQGQAFTRKNLKGGWDFTWLPKYCS